jgi:monofunctional biosynthetic peptidoglycan transglycosylase
MAVKKTTPKPKAKPTKSKSTEKNGFFGQFMRFFWKACLWFNIISLFFVVLYKFVPVPFTPLIAIRYFENRTYYVVSEDRGI